jgi:aminobenzoyl-glutamate utilization protein B
MSYSPGIRWTAMKPTATPGSPTSQRASAITGRAAHAAKSPDAGRSALDGVEIMTHALNLLREHVPQETRIHYVITKGGDAANIVPETAELSLIVRHPDQRALESIWERVLNCAQAGALATGTTMSFEVTSSYTNMVHTPRSS